MPPVWILASVPVFFSITVAQPPFLSASIVESADSTLFYGLAMDGTSGIVLDNFSLRGSSGLSLRSVPVWMMREFNEQRPYDLIILQYGLNVATERGRNYDKYIAGMQTTVQHPHSQRGR